MTNQQRLVIALVFVVAVVGGGALALAVFGGGSVASPSPIAAVSPSASSAASEAPSASLASEAASEEPSPSDAASPSAEPSATASPAVTPKPANPPGAPTTIVVQRLKLDAKDDPNGENRTLSFQSQGSGTITVSAKVTSPQGNVVMCLSADGKRLACKTTAGGKIVARTTTRKASFQLTLRGEGIETPIADITITFPAKTPSLSISNARFDGTGNPDYNGIQLLLQPRADGDATLSADWGGHPMSYEIDLIGVNGTAGMTLADQGPATRETEALPVTASDQWRVVLQNIEVGFGITNLDATISWP